MREPRTEYGMTPMICFTSCPLVDLPSEYPKASGTALMGLKKKRHGWKRMNCFKFRVS